MQGTIIIDTVKGDLHDIGKNDVNKIELNSELLMCPKI